MKQTFLIASLIGVFTFASCNKKETVVQEQTVANDTMQVTEAVVTQQEVKNPELTELEIKLKKAEQDLKDAVAKGDKKAEETAQKAINETKKAWDQVVEKTKDVAHDTKKELDKAGEKIDQKTKDVISDVKKGAEDAKKDINNAVDKIK